MSFRWRELMTTEVDSAARFYASVFGWEVDGDAGPVRFLADGHEVARASLLPARAAAHGAPPHWLGFAAVPDLDAAVARLCERGATRLGPRSQGAKGSPYQRLRDPWGAVIALAQRDSTAQPGATAFSWSELATTEVPGALGFYAEVFGWEPESVESRARIERLADRMGISDAARRPEVHPHWLFAVEVTDLPEARACVESLGGRAYPTLPLSSSIHLVACEDPQGAAFGLVESSP